MTHIRELRKEKHLTQQNVAEMLGMDRSAYTKLENGTRETDFSTLKKLAQFFNVSIDYLLDYSNNPTPTQKEAPTAESSERFDITPEERQLLDNFRSLNPSGKMHVISTAAMCAQNPAFTDNTQESSPSQNIV